jgi:hypothetical protein
MVQKAKHTSIKSKNPNKSKKLKKLKKLIKPNNLTKLSNRNNKKKTRKVRKKKENGTKKRGTMKGGGLFRKKAALSKAINNVQATELMLVKKHKSYARASSKFYDIYNNHISNLQKLDAFIPKLESFQELFTDVVMPDDIKPNMKINMANPLFLNQYNITEESTPRDIATEHIKQQVKYCMFKYFHPQDMKVITDIEVQFEETDITITFMINNFKRVERVIQHIGYKLDMNTLKAGLTTLIEEVKENVDFDYKPKRFSQSSILRIAPKHKSAKAQNAEKGIQLLGNSNESANMNQMIRKSQRDEIIEGDDLALAEMMQLVPGKKINSANNN